MQLDFNALRSSHATNEHAGPSGKFEGESMYHEKFPAHPVQQRAPRPLREAYRSSGGFDGTTTSGATYTAHPIPPRTVRPAYMHMLKLLATLSGH